MPDRENLLIVCCGDGSLHEAWFGPERSYDILTIYYGDDPAVAERFRAGSDVFVAHKGLKIELTRKVLLEELYFRRGFPFGQYAHVWFPDDDLRFDEGDGGIETLFEAARAVRADVFQPAVKNENYSESWESTRRIAGAFAHRTNIVEIMAFGFSGEAFEKAFLAAIHTCEFMKSGWGIEPIWMKIGEAMLRRRLRTFVFDAVPIVHTRPVGGGASYVHRQGRYEATYVPQIHTNRMVTETIYATPAEAVADQSNVIGIDHARIEQFHAAQLARFV
jgi:hypothetical protein